MRPFFFFLGRGSSSESSSPRIESESSDSDREPDRERESTSDPEGDSPELEGDSPSAPSDSNCSSFSRRRGLTFGISTSRLARDDFAPFFGMAPSHGLLCECDAGRATHTHQSDGRSSVFFSFIAKVYHPTGPTHNTNDRHHSTGPAHH